MSALGCHPFMGVLLALDLGAGIHLAFLAAQPGQVSKTAVAAFTLWPWALGGVAHVAPTRRFSPMSHLRRGESSGHPMCRAFLGKGRRGGPRELGASGAWWVRADSGGNPGSDPHQLGDSEGVPSILRSLVCKKGIVAIIIPESLGCSGHCSNQSVYAS